MVTMKRVIITFCILLVGSVAAVELSTHMIYRLIRAARFRCNSPSANLAKGRGVVICRNIGKYRCDHGVYPSTLEVLVPRYLALIPEPGCGDPAWRYAVGGGGQFYILSFGVNDYYPCCFWDSRDSQWHEDK